jgi:cytochrome o ubiquinol oxidase subunit 3
MMMSSTLTHDHHDNSSTAIFGFWIYILSDCILFAAIFAAFAVLHTSVYGGPHIGQLANLHYIFGETLVLLSSSFTLGLAILASYQANLKRIITWMSITFLLGLSFVSMELYEFVHLYHEGHTWQSSAALSSFFTLVGTHGLHVSIGLIWMLILMLQLFVFKITPTMLRRLTYFSLFWAFLDIIWIFVFTIVYLMEAI